MSCAFKFLSAERKGAIAAEATYPYTAGKAGKTGGCKAAREEDSARWAELVDRTALPAAAETFACYDGRETAKTATVPIFKAPKFAEAAVLLVEDFLTGAEVELARL